MRPGYWWSHGCNDRILDDGAWSYGNWVGMELWILDGWIDIDTLGVYEMQKSLSV